MRTNVEPPPSARCDHCHGELRLKAVIESGEHPPDQDVEIFVCVKCGREQKFTVKHGHFAPPPSP